MHAHIVYDTREENMTSTTSTWSVKPSYIAKKWEIHNMPKIS